MPPLGWKFQGVFSAFLSNSLKNDWKLLPLTSSIVNCSSVWSTEFSFLQYMDTPICDQSIALFRTAASLLCVFQMLTNLLYRILSINVSLCCKHWSFKCLNILLVNVNLQASSQQSVSIFTTPVSIYTVLTTASPSSSTVNSSSKYNRRRSPVTIFCSFLLLLNCDLSIVPN